MYIHFSPQWNIPIHIFNRILKSIYTICRYSFRGTKFRLILSLIHLLFISLQNKAHWEYLKSINTCNSKPYKLVYFFRALWATKGKLRTFYKIIHFNLEITEQRWQPRAEQENVSLFLPKLSHQIIITITITIITITISITTTITITIIKDG